MSDASMRVIDGRAVVRVGGSELLDPIVAGAAAIRDQTEDFADAGAASAALSQAKSVEASQYAAAASALANRFETYAAGNAATPAGQDFTVVDAAGGLINVYRKGTSTGADNPLVQLPGKAAYAASGGAEMIGYRRSNMNARQYRTLASKADDVFDARDLLGFQQGGANDMGPVISAGITAAASECVVLYLPGEGKAKPIAVGDPIILRDNASLSGEGKYRTIFQRLPGAHGPAVAMAPGTTWFNRIGGFQISGNGELGEGGMIFDAAGSDGASFGGLSYAEIHDIHIRHVRGKHLWLKGGMGNEGVDLPNQFVSLRDIVSIAGEMVEARPLSITGKVGQVYLEGHCQFDGQESGGFQLEGCNVCVSENYYHAASGTFGDAFDALTPNYSNMANVVIDMKPGWTLAPKSGGGFTDAAPYNIYLTGSIQGRHDGLFVSRGTVNVDKMRYEAVKRSMLVRNAGILIADRFEAQNAGTLLSAPDGKGFIGGAISTGTLIVGNEVIGGRADNLYLRLDSSGQLSRSSTAMVQVLNNDGTPRRTESIPSNTVLSLATVIDATIVLAANDAVRIRASNAPVDLHTILSSHPAGVTFTIHVVNEGVVRIVPGGNIAGRETRKGRPILLREGDSLTLTRTDGFNFSYEIVGRSIALLQENAAPTTGYHEYAERVWNNSPGTGTPLFWVCSATGSPASFVAGPIQTA